VEAGLAERQRRLQSRDPVTLLERALANMKAATAQPEISSTTNRFLRASDLTVDTMKRLVLVGGQPVDLTPTEFDVLTYLMCNQDRVVSCRELVAHLRGYDLDERDARVFLRSHVHRLRQKLERDFSNPCIIHTVRGQGYIISSESTESVSE
jgi:DNA-binding response OmpR family regulator